MMIRKSWLSNLTSALLLIVLALSSEAAHSCSVCNATLMYRPVYVLGIAVANHSFWYIYDSSILGSATGGWVLDGGPAGSCPTSCGQLVAWVTPGGTGHYSEDSIDNPQAGTAWNNVLAGLTNSFCSTGNDGLAGLGGTEGMYGYDVEWNSSTDLSYAIGASPNSNTFAHWDGMTGGGITNLPEPPDAVGW